LIQEKTSTQQTLLEQSLYAPVLVTDFMSSIAQAAKCNTAYSKEQGTTTMM
jgi:hypothetical protein